jgi:ribosomal protein S18 acetylase RimI-like enzyme
MIVKATFESGATGHEIYKVEEFEDLKTLEKELATCPYHVITKVDPANGEAIRFLASQGFCYSSTIVHLKLDLQGISRLENINMKKLSVDNKDQLFSICDEAFCTNHNRYTDDPFLKDFCAQIHRAWVLNSINGYADYNGGYFDGSRLAGFGTLHFKKDSAVIGLVATDKSYRAKGIGTQVVNDLITQAVYAKAKTLIVKTQATNFPALNLYCRNGFSLFGSEVTFYRERRKA